MRGFTSLPVRFVPTPNAQQALGPVLPGIAKIAVRIILAQGRGLDISHLQFRVAKHLIAVCCHVTRSGLIDIEIDLGNPNLPAVMITKAEFDKMLHRATPPRGTAPRKAA